MTAISGEVVSGSIKGPFLKKAELYNLISFASDQHGYLAMDIIGFVYLILNQTPYPYYASFSPSTHDKKPLYLRYHARINTATIKTIDLRKKETEEFPLYFVSDSEKISIEEMAAKIQKIAQKPLFAPEMIYDTEGFVWWGAEGELSPLYVWTQQEGGRGPLVCHHGRLKRSVCATQAAIPQQRPVPIPSRVASPPPIAGARKLEQKDSGYSSSSSSSSQQATPDARVSPLVLPPLSPSSSSASGSSTTSSCRGVARAKKTPKVPSVQTLASQTLAAKATASQAPSTQSARQAPSSQKYRVR